MMSDKIGLLIPDIKPQKFLGILLVNSRWIYLTTFFVLSFSSHFTFVVSGFRVRPEYILTLVGLILLLLLGRLPRMTIIPGWGFLVLWIIINFGSSLITAPVLKESIKSLILIVAGSLTLWCLTYLGKKESSKTTKLYMNIWFLSIILGIIGIGIDIALGTNYFSGTSNDVVAYRSARGLYWEANFYGISSMMLGIVYLDQWITKSTQTDRFLLPWRLVVCILAVLLSGTRSAQLTFFVGALILLSMRYRKARNWILRTIGILTVVILGLSLLISGTIHTSYTDRIIGTFTTPELSSSYTGRLYLASIAIGQMPNHWWIGHGTNTFGQFNPVFDDQGNVVYGQLGGYLGILPVTVLYDTGIIGLLVMAFWLISHFWNCFRLPRLRIDNPRLWSFTFASLLMFITFFSTNGLLISFPWVHMAMTLVVRSEQT
ncbi:MAG TPA: O-antigen ligase family protein [Prolixibacteraceae bacterium]